MTHFKFFLVVVIFCRSTEGCEDGWEVFGENCYLFSEIQYGWEDAKEYCETLGASLVKIEDKNEDDFVRQKLSEANFRYAWIGARYNPEYGEHRWLDGSQMTYDGWAPGRPGTDEGCVDYLQKYNYRWNCHCDCVYTRGPFICEKSCQDGWNLFNHKCYQFSTTHRSWVDAEQHCESDTGHLVIVDDVEEHDYIRQKISGINIKSAWVGALFDHRASEHRWIDGSSMTVNSWGPGQPGDTNGCVEYNNIYDYLWNSRPDCFKAPSPYICEKSCDIGWEKFGNKCYLMSRVHRGWEDAKSYCETVGASLVKVENEQEHQYIRQKISAADLIYVWIGARYDGFYKEHRWLDGSQMTFNGWASGRPGNDTGCVDYLRKFDYLWNSHCDCKRAKGPFICQKVLKVLSRQPETIPDVVTTTTKEGATIGPVTRDAVSTSSTVPGQDGTTRSVTIVSPDTDVTPDDFTKKVSSAIEKPPTVEVLPTISLPDFKATQSTTPTGTDRPEGSVAKIIQVDSKTYKYICNPDNSINVYDLPENTHYFAVQNYTSDNQTICPVSSINATAAKIEGCSKDLPIVFTFGSYQGILLKRILGGKSLTVLSITCKELPDSGVTLTVNESYNIALSLESEKNITPSYFVTSYLNTTTSNIGDAIAWTISFPKEYILEVTKCTAEPGTLSRADMRVTLISKGGCNINSDIVSNFTDNTDGTAVAIIRAFRFYNDEYVLLVCDVIVCPEKSSTSCDTTCSRQKRDIRSQTYSDADTSTAFLARVKSRLHVIDPHSGAPVIGSTLPILVALQITYVLLICLWSR